MKKKDLKHTTGSRKGLIKAAKYAKRAEKEMKKAEREDKISGWRFR
jgi:hypothetical protein